MLRSTNNLELFLVVGIGAGLYSFFKGFRVYREYRIVEDTPEIPIRSIPMGLVHIHGTATGDAPVPSPVTHTPCFFYKVEIERWESSGKSSGWVHYRTDIDGIEFYLQDTTGKVLVDARQAEFDLPQCARREIGRLGGSSWPTVFSGGGGLPATEPELRAYIGQVTTKKISSFIARGLAAAGPQSSPERESQRQAAMGFFQNPASGGNPFSQLFAAQAPLMERKLKEMGPQRDPKLEQARLEGLEAFNYPYGSPEFVQHAQHALELQGKPEEAQRLLAAMGFMGQGAPSLLDTDGPGASGRFRLTESCIVPGQTYDLTGTAAENPQPKDEHDRCLILKGQNEPTFLISSRPEKEVESNLRRRAALSIFGGAALALGCLAILLARLGWL